jgi:pre-mRNA-splicing factor ATP-dependent RNA helicase DHX38/PRP16
VEGISARNEHSNGPKGFSDFQRRLNRDVLPDRRNPQQTPRGGDSTRSARSSWETTPRDPMGAEGNWGGVRNRKWDAPTPRASRAGDTEDDESVVGLDMREWEEEQTKLDRDWYMANEDGQLMGDEEHNPLAQWEDLEAKKNAEIAVKQVKKISAKQAQYVSSLAIPWFMSHIPIRMQITTYGKPIVFSLPVLLLVHRSIPTLRTNPSPWCT